MLSSNIIIHNGHDHNCSFHQLIATLTWILWADLLCKCGFIHTLSDSSNKWNRVFTSSYLCYDDKVNSSIAYSFHDLPVSFRSMASSPVFNKDYSNIFITNTIFFPHFSQNDSDCQKKQKVKIIFLTIRRVVWHENPQWSTSAVYWEISSDNSLVPTLCMVR